MRKWSLVRIWTLEEEEILRKYYPKERTKGVRKRMPYRTMSSIYAKAYNMGMRLIDYQSPTKKWSTRELNILEKFYPSEGVACIKRLKRSKNAVVAMAGVLGLQRQLSWSSEEDAVLLKYYQSEGPDCYKRLSNRSRQAAQHRAMYLGLTAKKRWSEKEIAFVKNYPDLEIEELQKRFLPDRTQNAILNQRTQLEASGELAIPKKREFWSEEEDAILRQHYPTEGGDCDKYLPNRKRTTIRQRARMVLGLDFLERPEWSDEEDAVLLKYYQSEGTDCYKRLPNRTRAATQHRAGFLGLTVNKKRVWSEEEIDIFDKNHDLDLEELQKLLPGRTTSAIKMRRERLKARGELSKNKKFWSEEDEAILRQYYPTLGADCDKYLPNRSRRAVKDRAKRLGLHFLQKPYWSDEEDAVLLKYYQSEGPNCYKRLPKRTKGAVETRAGLLGLTAEPSRRWSEEEIDLLKNSLELDIEELQTLLPDRTQSAIENRRNRLAAGGELTLPKPREFWSDEEDAVLLKYYPSEGASCYKRLPNRTKCAVQSRAWLLNLMAEKSPRRSK